MTKESTQEAVFRPTVAVRSQGYGLAWDQPVSHSRPEDIGRAPHHQGHQNGSQRQTLSLLQTSQSCFLLRPTEPDEEEAEAEAGLHHQVLEEKSAVRSLSFQKPVAWKR